MNRPRRSISTTLVIVLAIASGCVADETPSSTPTGSPGSSTPTPTLAAPSESPAPSPSPTPEPPLSLPLPGETDARIVAASVSSEIADDAGTLTITVTSADEERIDELVLRWPAELNEALFLAPFTPSEERIRDGGPPLVQAWTKWVVGPGEQGEPAGTISLGYGPLLPGATLAIQLAATRAVREPVAFDLQVLSRNDLLTLAGGAPAELRVEVP